MERQEYDIVMKTSVGDRKGIMIFNVDNGVLNGHLNILKEENPFQGTIDERGNFCTRGDLKTLVRRILYDATGRMSERTLYLKLLGGREIFEICGTAVSEEEKEQIS